MLTATNATNATAEPRPLSQRERDLCWAAVLLQLEIGVALVYSTLLLPLASRQPTMPALFAVLAAALLFPLGSRLAAGSRIAAIIIAALFTLRIVEAFTAPSFETFLRMMPLLLLEGFVLLRGVTAALQSTDVHDPLAHEFPLLRDSVPVVIALGLVLVMPYTVGMSFAVEETERGFAALHMAGLIAFALAIALVTMHRLPQRILLLARGTSFDVSRAGDWPRQAWYDITTGAAAAAACMIVVNWYGHVSEWPPLMTLLLPLPHAVFAGYIVAALWFCAAYGEVHRSGWAARIRSTATTLVLLYALLVGPLLLGVLSEVLLELMQL